MVDELNADTVRELLHYDPDTGALTWRPRARRWFATERSFKIWNTRYAGRPAGHYKTQSNGYRRQGVGLLGRDYYVGPVVWLYMTGAWPKGEVDHIDRVACNQKWSNLRDVTAAQNRRNMTARTRREGSGYPGVDFLRKSGGGIWRARIQCDGKRIHLGHYDTLLDAVAAKKRAERELGFSPGHGQPRPEGRKNHG